MNDRTSPPATLRELLKAVRYSDFPVDADLAEQEIIAMFTRSAGGVPPGWRAALQQIRVNMDAGGTSVSNHDFLHEHGGALLDKVEEALESLSSPIGAFTREEAAKLVERKAEALTFEYCRGDSGPGGYTWLNKEAEWQVILLEELAEEFRRGA